MANGYNTKVEGHRGEAARLEQMAKDLLAPAAKRKEIAAELRERAARHWTAAEEALLEEVEAIEALLEPVGALWNEQER